MALACLAAIHDEVPQDNEVFVAAMQRLSKAKLADTYELSLRLMVMAEFQDFPDLDTLARVDLQKLLGNRRQEIADGLNEARELSETAATRDRQITVRLDGLDADLESGLPRPGWGAL